tara:strand:+ start:265 stop:582 length:318 start_codon:yes stop_codon:yes gene_type:complete
MQITEEQLKKLIETELDHERSRLKSQRMNQIKGDDDLLSKYLNIFDGAKDHDPSSDRHPKLNAILEAVKDAYGKVPMDQLVGFLRNLHRELAVNKKVMREDDATN